MTNRLLSVPLSPVALNTEVNTIKCIANNNNIRLNIDNIIRKKLSTRSLDAATSLPRGRKVLKKAKWMRPPYLGIFSNTLRGVLKPANRRPAYYSLNTTRQHLCRLKDPIPQTQRIGVDRITCGDCPATYIGETGPQISVRFKEHCDTITKNRPKTSAFGAHILQTGHSIDRACISLLHEENAFRKRLALEHLEIIKHKNNIGKYNLVNDFIPSTRSLIEIVYV